ncbi:uncharacterized protein SAPINGB_P002123 [Magnusiomyces paraingens]|uniref:F-box domain-containing protein n=1 Tax=Magnusiomyces paraingens TaxID=2606893 RepID=A0A5E8BDN1_9ASCO|nr:uncharacterized protein SAPINGB_P002123 [Saprochaete ingens]VVT49139.1 unnamed protein product [Saprochaete ingens]
MKSFSKLFKSRSSFLSNSTSPPLNSSSSDISESDSASHVIFVPQPQHENDYHDVFSHPPKIIVSVEEIPLSSPLSQPSHCLNKSELDFARKRHRASSSSNETNISRRKSILSRILSRKRSKYNNQGVSDLLIPITPATVGAENIIAHVDSSLVGNTHHHKRSLSLCRVFSFNSKKNLKRNSVINTNLNTNNNNNSNKRNKRVSIFSFSSDIESLALNTSQDSDDGINSSATDPPSLIPNSPVPMLEYQRREIIMPSKEEQQKYAARLREITVGPQKMLCDGISPAALESTQSIPQKQNSNSPFLLRPNIVDSLILEPCTDEDILKSIESVVKVQTDYDKKSDSLEQGSNKEEPLNFLPSKMHQPPSHSEDLQSYRENPAAACQQYQLCDDMWEVSGASDLGDTEDNGGFVRLEQAKRPTSTKGSRAEIILPDGVSSISDVEEGEANRTRHVVEARPRSKLSRVISSASGFTDDSKVYDGDVEEDFDYDNDNDNDDEEREERERLSAVSNVAICNPDDDGYNSDTSSSFEDYESSSFEEDIIPCVNFLGEFQDNNIFENDDNTYSNDNLDASSSMILSEDEYFSAQSSFSSLAFFSSKKLGKRRMLDIFNIWDLSSDIHHQISKYLIGHDLINMAQTCNALRPIYSRFSWTNCIVVSGNTQGRYCGPGRTLESLIEVSCYYRRYYYFKRYGNFFTSQFANPEFVNARNARYIPFRVFLNPDRYSWFFSKHVIAIKFECMFASVSEGKEWNKIRHFSDLYIYYPKLLYVKVGYNALSNPPQPAQLETSRAIEGNDEERPGYAESVFSISSDLSDFAHGKSGAALVYSLLDDAEVQGFTTLIPSFEVQLVLESPYYLINLPGKLVLRTLDVEFFFDIDSNSMSAGYDISEFKNLETLRLIFKSITYKAHWIFMAQILELPHLRRLVTSINPLSKSLGNDRLYSVNNWVNLLRNLSLICPETNDRLFFRGPSALDDISISGSFEPIKETEITTVPGKLFFPRVTEVVTDSVDIFNYAKFGPKLKSLKILDNFSLPNDYSSLVFFSELASNISENLTSLCLHCLEGTRSITGLIPLLSSPLVQNIKTLTLNIDFQYDVFSTFSPYYSSRDGPGTQPCLHKESCPLSGLNLNHTPDNIYDTKSTLARICNFLEFLSTENLIPLVESCYEDGQRIDMIREKFYSVYGPMMVEREIDNYNQMISSLCINPMVNIYMWNREFLSQPVGPCEYHLYMASLFECIFDSIVHTMFSLEYLRINGISKHMERPIWKYVTNSLRFQEHFGSYLKAPYSSELDREKVELDYHALKQLFINQSVPLGSQNCCSCILDRNYEFAHEVAQTLPANYTTVVCTSPPKDIAIVLDIEARRKDFSVDSFFLFEDPEFLLYLDRADDTDDASTIFRSSVFSDGDPNEYYSFNDDEDDDDDEIDTMDVESLIY